MHRQQLAFRRRERSTHGEHGQYAKRPGEKGKVESYKRDRTNGEQRKGRGCFSPGIEP